MLRLARTPPSAALPGPRAVGWAGVGGMGGVVGRVSFLRRPMLRGCCSTLLSAACPRALTVNWALHQPTRPASESYLLALTRCLGRRCYGFYLYHLEAARVLPARRLPSFPAHPLLWGRNACFLAVTRSYNSGAYALIGGHERCFLELAGSAPQPLERPAGLLPERPFLIPLPG